MLNSSEIVATKIEKLKNKHKFNTSEELFDIKKPIEHQCPNFDSVVNEINSASSALKYERWEDEESVELALEKISDAEYYLSSLVDEIEKLRTAIEEVREWGTDWKSFAKRVIENNDIDLEKYISE